MTATHHCIPFTSTSGVQCNRAGSMQSIQHAGVQWTNMYMYGMGSQQIFLAQQQLQQQQSEQRQHAAAVWMTSTLAASSTDAVAPPASHSNGMKNMDSDDSIPTTMDSNVHVSGIDVDEKMPTLEHFYDDTSDDSRDDDDHGADAEPEQALTSDSIVETNQLERIISHRGSRAGRRVEVMTSQRKQQEIAALEEIGFRACDITDDDVSQLREPQFVSNLPLLKVSSLRCVHASSSFLFHSLTPAYSYVCVVVFSVGYVRCI
jgi:hypothetical protein